MVSSEVGQCGCLIGMYAAWGGETIAVVDLPHQRCPDDHRQGEVLGEAVSVTTPTEGL
jgi:hypothetical protein